MKSHSSIQVVRMWCRIHTDPLLRCFNNSDGMNCGSLLVGIAPQLFELANSLRLSMKHPDFYKEIKL
jgi:hypothetical protein